jgi:hypothetical protein
MVLSQAHIESGWLPGGDSSLGEKTGRVVGEGGLPLFLSLTVKRGARKHCSGLGWQGFYRDPTLPWSSGLTFSEKLGRDKNSNDKTGINVASSPYTANSCK